MRKLFADRDINLLRIDTLGIDSVPNTERRMFRAYSGANPTPDFGFSTHNPDPLWLCATSAEA